MITRRGKRNDELEAAAAAFLAGAESPRVSHRMREYGLQRVHAKAKAAEPGKTPAARRAYRNPALLRHALIVAIVVLLAMVMSTSGAYALSLDAQPDSPLYGTKIFFERARVTLTTSSAADMRLEMGFSERRMEELRNMVASGNREGAERWLHEYSRNVEGAGTVFETVADREAQHLSTQFQEKLEQQAQVMREMREGQPAALSEPIDSAYEICQREQGRMRQRCGQQDQGGQESGGQHGQGYQNDTADPSCGESDSPAVDESMGDGAGSTGTEPSYDTSRDTTTGTSSDVSSGTSQPESAPSGESGRFVEGEEVAAGWGEYAHGRHIPR
jgi:hypothetical protein